MYWDYDAAFADLMRDREDNPAPIYAGILEKDEVRRLSVDNTAYDIVLSWDRVIEAVQKTKILSNVTPRDGGMRIIPLQTDPPEHTAYRRMLNQHFADQHMDDLESTIRPMAAEMIDTMVAAGSADFATEFAYPFPTRALCALLHLPDDDWHFHHTWVTNLETLTKDGLSDPSGSIFDALAEVIPYLFGLIAQRREQPGNDPISEIIKSEIDGEPLSDEQVGQILIALMMAGHITTTAGVGNLVRRLGHDPGLQSFLRDNPHRIGDAVEESLRLDSPQQAMPRRALEDVDLGGQQIKSGEYVLLNFGSANVDPQHWPEPETFDIDRPNKRHVAFGRGVHQCVGAPMARMEMRVVAEEMLARTTSFTLPEPAQRVAWPRLCVEHMTMSFQPAG
jgi:cytochrome P450